MVAVIHVFYPALWPEIAEGLRRLPMPVDVVVTVAAPRGDDVRRMIRADYPHAIVLPVPNRGRDVLPFVRVVPSLRARGWTTVLKLHTKRSVHIDDGSAWFTRLLDELTGPSGAVNQAVASLEGGASELVGPGSFWYPLDVAWSETAGALAVVAGKVGLDLEELADRRWELGFFAGTMFWARLEALDRVQSLGTNLFAVERGQRDGTAAHALERVFALLPQMRGRPVSALSEGRLVDVADLPFTRPDWYRSDRPAT